MSPAMTQIIVDIGHGGDLVGVGTYDPAAGKLAPIVGDLYQLDYEKLLAAGPTHLFLQPGKPGVPAKLTEMARRHHWRIYSREIELRDDALEALSDIGRLIGAPEAATKLRGELEQQWREIETITASAPKLRTLLAVGRNPMTCAGPETFLSQMLSSAGGANALEKSVNRYPVIDKETALKLDPEIILLVMSGEWDQIKMPILSPSLMDRMRAITDEQALLPSTTMVRVMANMAKVIHPELADRIDAAMNLRKTR